MEVDAWAFRCRTLAEARAYIARCGGAIRVERNDGTATNVVEAWI